MTEKKRARELRERAAKALEVRKEAIEFALEAIKVGAFDEERAVLFIREVANRAAAAAGLTRPIAEVV